MEAVRNQWASKSKKVMKWVKTFCKSTIRIAIIIFEGIFEMRRN